MINKVILLGNLGKDAETREFGDHKVTSFTLATTQNWKDGENWKSRTEWHNVEQFNMKGIERYKKGTKVYLEGSIRYENYEKDGVKKYVTKIKPIVIKVLDKQEKQESSVSQEEIPF